MGFSSDTAVRHDGDGRFTTAIRPRWDVAGNANGGYMLSIVVRSMREASSRPDPVTVTGHFLAPGQPGPAEVVTDVVKRGRALTTLIASLHAGGRRLVQAVGAFGDLSAATGPERVDAAPPELPPPEDCARVVPAATFPPPFMGQVDLRLHPHDARFAEGAPSGEPRVRGWFRLPGGEPIDSVALILAVDAFPPTTFNARLPVAWTPTIELTAHVRARPARGWLRCAFTTRFVTGGFLEEDGEVWDETDTLVAQSRQLALVPRAG